MTTTTRQAIKRLEMMVDMLERHSELFPNTKFDLSGWHCGTAACAVGSACFHKPFMKMGLTLNIHTQSPAYKGSYNWVAVEEFFGLTFTEAIHLFSRQKYPCYMEDGHPDEPTTKDVIKRVRKQIAKMKRRKSWTSLQTK